MEVSPYLRREQWKKLQCTTTTITTNSTSSTSSSDGSNASSSSSSRAQSDQLPESGLSEISGSQVRVAAGLRPVLFRAVLCHAATSNLFISIWNIKSLT